LVWKRWSRNLGTKLLSFLVAVGLWLSVTNQIEFENELVFPIEYTNWPAGLTAVQPLPDEVRARVRGKGKFMRYTLRDGVCRIDMSGNQIGFNTIAVNGGDLVLPTEVEVARAEVLEPMRISVELDETVIRDVPIHPTVLGEPDSRHVQVGKTFVNPTVARVKGPRKLVDEITLLSTKDFDIGGSRSTMRKRVRLVAPEHETVEVTPSMVEIGITIEPLVTRRIENVTLSISESDSGYLATFRPPSISIEITGARSIVGVAVDDVTNLTLQSSAWRPGTSILSFVQGNGRELVFTPNDSVPVPTVGLPGPTSTDSTAKPVGSSASPKDRLPAALEGTAIGQLPLPRDVAVISVEPRRVVVIVSTATETPRIVKSENSP
jgi:hypothetical protein